jgi:glutamate synthase domain-containing protein 2
LREHVKLGASGKVVTGFNMAVNMALGADWCNAARGFMFALGCLQSQHCHTDRCPTGIATQNPWRQRSLVVPDKAQRVCQFHKQSVAALAEILSTVGLEHSRDLRPRHISRRINEDTVKTAAEIYRFLEPGELLNGCDDPYYGSHWRQADAGSFNGKL